MLSRVLFSNGILQNVLGAVTMSHTHKTDTVLVWEIQDATGSFSAGFFFLYLMFSVVPTVESLCRILSYAHLSGDLCPIKDARCLPWSLCSGQHPGTLLSSERLHHGPPASPITSP